MHRTGTAPAGTARRGARHRIVVLHTIDPRGDKVGGIETHVRLLLAKHPPEVSVLLVGVDEIGDAPLGEVIAVGFEGRVIEFLPVARVAADEVNVSARRLIRSVTLRFAWGALRHLGAIRRAIGPGPASADLSRFEFAPLARLLGLPAVQMVHEDGDRSTKPDSLLRRYWFLHRLNRLHALGRAGRIVCVNPDLAGALRGERPELGGKLSVMSVSVDTARFRPSPFRLDDGVFRLVYAGRLDAVKDPPLMFETVRRLRDRLGEGFAFHYVGAGDPARFAEFAAIAEITARHGRQDAAGVATVLARCHAGILTSISEGLPAFLLEGTASGRPFGAVRLPAYEGVITPQTGGRLVRRATTRDESAAALAEALLAIWADIRDGRIDPERVAAAAEPFAASRQLAAFYDLHRGLAAGMQPA